MIDPALTATNRYAHGTRARYNADKCRCFDCRRANSAYEAQRKADPRISADPVRAHIAALAAQGIGLRAISDATDIPRVALKRWQLGQPTIKRSLAEKILATDASIIADHATVDAQETQILLSALIDEGYTKTRLASLLGSEARLPALQFKGGRVLAKTAQRVRKLYDALTAEGEDLTTAAVGPRDEILSALKWFDEIESEDLFDSMSVNHDMRNVYAQALHRLWKSGEVVRVGSRKPYRYSTPIAAAVVRANVGKEAA